MPTQQDIETQAQLLAALLPRGKAWPKEPDSSLMAFAEGVAVDFAVVEKRAEQVLLESQPGTTTEMLSDWEDALGLPDCCTSLPETEDARRAAVDERYFWEGGQSTPYFQALCEKLGYTVEIEKFKPFICGISEIGIDPIGGTNTDYFYWKILVKELPVYKHEIGISEIGVQRITDFARAEDLECLLNRLMPADSELLIGYGAI